MISKLDANDLLDVYGDLLTKRQREILSLYYEEDFSYTEISEANGGSVYIKSIFPAKPRSSAKYFSTSILSPFIRKFIASESI